MTTLRLAVVSDLHVYNKAALSDGERRPSFLELGASANNPGDNPYAGLKELIREQELSADALVCCGDIGDKAQPESTAMAWKLLQEIRGDLGASEIVVTAGNHDLDSRHLHNAFDAKGTLQALDEYPFADPALNDQYWSRNVVIVDRGGFRYVVLNSAAYHGVADEWMHGRVARSTVSYLERELLKRPQPSVNILVCHHHVYRIGGIDLTDYSEMQDASVLLEMIERNNFGRWLIIHGHRHWPYISYAPGSSSSPVVFSAGSLAAVLYDELSDKARNQFYILDVDLSDPGNSLRGRFTAWDWIVDAGFQPAQEHSGLPATGGFGVRIGGDELAARVYQLLQDEAVAFLSWSQLETLMPEVRHVAPRDMQAFARILEDRYNVPVLKHRGAYSQIGCP